LLVEDEHLVREALARLLGSVAEVTSAASVSEALAALNKARFDLVVSDHDLGSGPNGVELLRQVASRWPECGRVLHANIVTPEIRAERELGVVQSVAEKPVSVAELKQILAAIRAKKIPKPGAAKGA